MLGRFFLLRVEHGLLLGLIAGRDGRGGGLLEQAGLDLAVLLHEGTAGAAAGDAKVRDGVAADVVLLADRAAVDGLHDAG